MLRTILPDSDLKKPISGFRGASDPVQLQADSLSAGGGGGPSVGAGEESVPAHHGHLRHPEDREPGQQF